MQRTVAAIFILVYSFSFTEFHQALKLPLLFKHYQEHSSTVEMSFLEFLVMHYETDEAHDDTDMRLPFKTCGHSSVVQSVALVNHSITLKAPVAITDHSFISFDQQIFISSLSHDIFQPPRA